MEKPKFKGTGTALVTPFTSDGSIDESALLKLVDFQLSEGIDMLLPCGTTGEGATLDTDEYQRVIELVVERVAGRIPVFVGGGCNSTARAIYLSKLIQTIGADGVLSVAPYYNKPPQEGIYQHFKSISESVDIPIILYNVPSRTGSNISAETVLRLAELPGIVAIKEASDDISHAMAILRHRPDQFSVLSGNDAATAELISFGADGLVSVAANVVPAMTRKLVNAALSGNMDRANELHFQLLPLMNALFIESNPIPVKSVLAMMGMIHETYRLPLVPISGKNKEDLKRISQEIGLIQESK